ncbi:MAG: tetratricopeptide repeat protein [Polyangiaceae bacterium]
MSVDTIRVVLGRLQDAPESETAWEELAEIVTAPGELGTDILRLLEQARARFEKYREWPSVARLLEMEISLSSREEPAMQAELARVFDEELLDANKARDAYDRLLEFEPVGELAERAASFLEADEGKQTKWKELYDRYVSEAETSSDDSLRAVLFLSAADVALRYAGADLDVEGIAALVERAISLDPKARRAIVHAEVALAQFPARLAKSLEALLARGATKEERIAAGLKAGRVYASRVKDRDAAVACFEQVLDLSPGQPDALSFLVEAYTANEQWDHLVALYEDQLKGGVRGEAETGILLQIGMVHWRMRKAHDLAEPFFDRIRRIDPANSAVLSFFRDLASLRNDTTKLATVLSDAQRSTNDANLRKELAAEIARLAEAGDNAQKAIDQYKAILKTDPTDTNARDALKRLYSQTAAFPALVDLLRHELERLPAEDKAGRAAVLREMAGIHRDRAKNEQQLVSVLQQLVAADESDQEALRELIRIYESLGRFRDLITCQQRLAEATTDADERAELFRAVARRWGEQFSNVQNAIQAYEGLLEARPADAEARSKLRELYTKRRAWSQLFSLYEIEAKDAEGATLLELLGEMAKLAAERLDRGADAIKLQKRILDLDPTAMAVYEALEKLAEREKDYETLADVLERREKVVSDVQAKLAILQKLGAVYSDRLKDHVAATRTWRRVLDLAPGQAKALRVLRESYVASGDYDALEDLYAAQEDWDALADFLSSSADKATEPGQKIELSFRAATVYESKLGAPERSVRSYERVLSVDPGNARAARALVPMYEKEERWARLPALYEILLSVAEDSTAKVAVLRKLAHVTGHALGDRGTALGHARHAYELIPDEENLHALEGASRAASSWGPFVEALEKRLAQKGSDGAHEMSANEERQLRLKLANAYARELGKLDEAVAAYRTLVEADPTDEETMHEFDALLRGAERKDDLRWLFELRIKNAEEGERARIYEEWATLEEDVFASPKDAIVLYRKASELDPNRGATLRALSRLLLAEGEHAQAAEVIAHHRDLSEGAERAAREVELAFLYVDHLGKPVEALESCERALAQRPRDPDAIGILARLVDVADTRARAARVLQHAYAELGDARRQSQMLRVMLETATEPAERLELHITLAEVEEVKLSSPGAAFDITLRALNEFPSEIALWDRAQGLSSKSGRPTDLAEAYRVHVISVDPEHRTLSKEVELELGSRAATLHDDQLGDPDGALPYLKRILAMDGHNQWAFERLKQILTTAERWDELEELFDQAAQAAEQPAQKISLLTEVALIAEEVIGLPAKAIAYHERILEIDPLHVASLDALEKLYEDEERFSELASLLERRLETAIDDEAVDIRLYLGRLYLEQLLLPERALAHVEAILRSRHEDADARELAERMLEIGSLKLRTAMLLETVYEARDEVRSLVRMLEIRLEAGAAAAAAAEGGAAESWLTEQKALLRRIGELKDERLKDDPGAFEALSKLVPLVPDDEGVRDRFVEIGKRLGKHEEVAKVLSQAADAAESKVVRAAVLMLMASVVETSIGDAAQAEAVYRRVLAIDPNDTEIAVPAARALARLQAEGGRHAALAETLEIEVKLDESVDGRKALYERLGDLYESMLEDLPKASEVWRSRLRDDAGDEKALTALERLYEKQGKHRDLVDILRRREEVSGDATERKRAMVKAAEILAGPVGELTEATQAWRAVLDAFGADRQAHAALASLYEKTEHYQDLAEILDADLALAEETEDKIKLYRRLGDVRRTHLSDLDGSLDAYRQALELEPGDVETRAALELLLEISAARKHAAELLHPLYEADGDAPKLLRVLDIEAEVAESASERIDKLEKARATAEGPLGDVTRAYDYASRALREAVGDERVGKQMETMERLTTATERWADTCTLYKNIAQDVLDGDVQNEMLLRIGELSRDKLNDADTAVTYYRKALEGRPDEKRALLALESLYAAKDDAQSLLDILKKREDLAESDSERKELIFREADLLREKLKSPADAIERLEAALAIDVDERATSQLEELYTNEKRYEDLVRLYERMLEAASSTSDKAASLRVKIARIAREKLENTARAFDELAEALSILPDEEKAAGSQGNAEAIAELETILDKSDKPEERGRAGEMLESIYLRQGNWDRVKRTIEARLEASTDSGERMELLKTLARLHEEQLENYTAAMDATARLLHEDVADRAVWSELERLARVATAQKKLAEIYAAELALIPSDDETTAELAKRAGEIFAEVGDVDAALKLYRRAHAFEPENEALFEAIEKLLVKEQRHAERVDLMRNALDYRDGAKRLELLHTIADLEETKLSRDEDAIQTYNAALEYQANDTLSLDRLTELYKRLARHKDLASLYQTRIDGSESPEKAAPFRLALARLLRKELKDTGAAIDNLEAIVSDVPWMREAIADLEELTQDEEHKARVVEILRPLYERADDWQPMVKLNQERLALATEKADRAAILRENARLFETRALDKKKAFEALGTAFDVDPEDAETREELERLARELEAFESLADAFERVLASDRESSVDDVTRRELLIDLANVYDDDLDDPRCALSTFERLSAAFPDERDVLDEIDDLAVLLGDWKRVASVLEKKAEGASDSEAAEGMRRLGQVQEQMLEDVDAAVKAYERALELESDSTVTIDRLIPLYEGKDESRRLVELYARRVELATPEESDLRYDLNVKTAERYRGPLASARDAIAAFVQALEARPGDRPVLVALEKLYRDEGMHQDLLDNLRDQAAAATEVEERARLRVLIGDLYKDKLSSPADALEQYRLVLEEAPTNEGALAAVRMIAEQNDDLRIDATETLLPVLRQTGRHEDRVAVLELRLKALTDSELRAAALKEIATVLDAELKKPSDALTALLRALEDAPEDNALHDEIARLADTVDAGFGRYADALAERAEAALDAGISRSLWARLGAVAEDRLKDDARAAKAFAKALDQAAGDESEAKLLVALDRLYERLGSHKELSDILERRMTFGNDAEQAELYYRLAKLQIHVFKEPQAGLGSLRSALERKAGHEGAREELEKLTAAPELFDEVAETLEGVYRQAADSRALAGLFEKRIGYAKTGPDRLRLRLDLARVLEDQAHDPKAALGALLVALDDDPSDSDVLAEIERVAAIVDGWADAATALEKAIASGKSSLTSETSSDLWNRAAGWRRDKINDLEGAERDYEQALSHDSQNEVILRAIEQIQRAPGRERDLVATLRRLAALDGIAQPAELRKEANSIARSQLGDDALAEAILRDMVTADEADAWALAELTELRRKAGDAKETFKLLVRRTELAGEADAVKKLRHEAAEVARNELKDIAAATELYDTIFEDEPTDERASKALRELYAEAGKKKDLLKLLGRLVDVADSPKVRAELRLEAARVSDELDATTDGIELLHAILEDDPAHRDAALMLSRLLEKTGRDDDLASLLERQISLAKERSDVDGELSYRLRLGEVQEARLGDLEKAASTFEVILDRDKAHKGALVALARIQEKRGDKKSAAGYLERVLELESGDDAIATAKRLATLFDQLGDDEGTQRALERGLSVRERETEIRGRLRTLYEKKQDWAKLAALLSGDAEAATENPEKIRLFRTTADIFKTKLKDPAKAADALLAASQLAPQDRELLLLLCDAYTESGRGKQAVEVLQKIVESYGGRRSKEVAVIHHRLASAYLADGDRQKALSELDTAFKIDPGSIVVLRDLGTLSLELADADAANKDAYVDRAGKTFKALLLQRLDDNGPIGKAEVFYYLGDVAHRQNDDKKAIQMLERALDNDKNLAKAKDLLAKLKK